MWRFNTLSGVTHVSPVHRIVRKKGHPQCFHGVAILRIPSLEDDHLEKHVCPASNGVDAVDHNEVLRGTSVEIILILLRYRLSFFTALVPQIIFSSLHWLVSVQSVGDPHLRVP